MKNINVSYINKACYVVIEGDMEFNESTQFLDIIKTLLKKNYPTIVIDLGNCKYIDSLGLTTLNQAYELSKKENKKLLLCNLDKDCENILFMTTLWNKVPIKENLESCLQAV